MTIHYWIRGEVIDGTPFPEKTVQVKLATVTQNQGPDGSRRLVCWPKKPGPCFTVALENLIAIDAKGGR